MINPRKPQSYTAIAVDWAPVLVWMTVIFLFSTDYFSATNTVPFIAPLLSNLFPELATGHLENIILLIRKLGHFSEYSILALLLMRALNAEFAEQSAKSRINWSIALVVIYAVSDEWHQAFVPSRTASPWDVLIDLLGGICGTLWFHRRKRRNIST
jgi:VanZ family protein